MIGRGLACDDGHRVVDRHAQPHAVQLLARVHIAAIPVDEPVALGVGKLRLDVLEPVIPAVAADLDVDRSLPPRT
jgi:hypothetical protein